MSLNIALDTIQKALAGFENTEEPTNIQDLRNEAHQCLQQGDVDGAEEKSTQLLRLSAKKLGVQHHTTLQLFCRVGCIYWEQDRVLEAKEMFIYVAVALETANPKGNCLLVALHHLGKAHYVLGEMRDAEKRLCQALHEHQKSDHSPVITLVIIDRALYGLDIAYDLCRIYYEQGKMVPHEVAWFRKASLECKNNLYKACDIIRRRDVVTLPNILSN